MSATRAEPGTMRLLLDRYSVEVVAGDPAALAVLPAIAPRPAEVFVPLLPHEPDELRIQACATLRAAGLVPVPHVAARRIESAAALEQLLDGLHARAGVDRLFLIAGDLPRAFGPFPDSLAILDSGLLERYGIAQVGIAGHPDGHSHASPDMLWEIMRAKLAALERRGMESEIVTQFSFDARQVLNWLRAMRDRRIRAPVRIGVPGPAGARTLLRYATRCGVSASAGAIGRYGLSLGRLLSPAGPDAFLADLAAGLDPSVTGAASVHFFPFGGLSQLRDWLERNHSSASAAA